MGFSILLVHFLKLSSVITVIFAYLYGFGCLPRLSTVTLASQNLFPN